jgi:6-phosphofructokinase 1
MSAGPLFVLTSGGDAPGMNMAIRAVAKIALSRGVRPVGVLDGWDGLIDGRFRELSRIGPGGPCALAELDVAANVGGTVLGSARSARFRTPEGRGRAAAHLEGASGLVVVGGDGSLTGAHLFAREHGVRVMGIPASIDNDLGCTATAIGVDTALNTIVDACDRIADTARSHRRAFVVEVMGRRSGYLAIAAAIAAGADAVLFREQGRSEDALVDAVERSIRQAFEKDGEKRRVLILKAEGVDVPCTRLVRLVESRFEKKEPAVEVRATVLGHLVRGGSPSYQDRMIANRFALSAVEALLEGHTDEMTAWQPPVPGGIETRDPAIRRFSLDAVLAETAALADGTSPVARWRLSMMDALEGVLGL